MLPPPSHANRSQNARRATLSLKRVPDPRLRPLLQLVHAVRLAAPNLYRRGRDDLGGLDWHACKSMGGACLFRIHQFFKRRTDLHVRYGGQKRGGISRRPAVRLSFSSPPQRALNANIQTAGEGQYGEVSFRAGKPPCTI
jgi:hypothetical protein